VRAEPPSPADEQASVSGDAAGAAEDGEAAGARRARSALLVDWGGVMTTSPFDSFNAFCAAEGLDPQALTRIFRGDPQARELLFSFEEGRLAEAEFELALAELLGVSTAEGLIDRLFSRATPDEPMVAAVRAARAAGVRTGLISNSWGTGRYPRELLAELFDGLVISGEVGIRKPAARIYELGAEAAGGEPAQCVFVDDLPFNLPPAERLGMATVHHTSAGATIRELERLFGITLSARLAASPRP
jgi:putative hydrolase of the HAD superfamily